MSYFSYLQSLPFLFVDLPEVSVESWLGVECLLAPSYWALVALWLTVDGLNMHEEIVANAEPTSTFLALRVCVCACVCVCVHVCVCVCVCVCV